MNIQIPEWVKNAVFYQIFPDRFARSERVQQARGLQFKPWGTPPDHQGYQGGDLLGVVDKLGYLQELGVTAIYLNPVFASASNHRYHTYDYYTVDPLLGGNDALQILLDAAHARGMRIVLDGVFNHASRGFWAFHHILENGDTSPYIDWFHIHGWPLRPYPEGDQTLNYDAWWGLPSLPKFNTNNPGVRDYLLDVARYWIDFGVDGWRLDVPDEINDEGFWQDFRHTVKQANPEAYIVGEMWGDAHEWLRGDRFDAVMNYGFSRAAYGFFGHETLRTEYRPGGYELRPLNVDEFAQAVEEMNQKYDWAITQAQLNLMDSHDTGRMLWTVNGDESALRLAALFQMTMPGAPCIYYGDEVGMTGGTDPDCRGAFPWHEHEQWNHDLLHFYRHAIALRHRYPALRAGTFKMLYAENGVYGFRRDLDEECVIVLFNRNHEAVVVDVSGLDDMNEGQTFVGCWNGGEYKVQSETLHNMPIPARDALILYLDK